MWWCTKIDKYEVCWFFIFTTTRLIELSNVELVCYTGYTPATLQNLLHIGIVLLGRYFIPVTNCSKLLHIVTYWDIPAGWVCHCCHCIMGYNVLYFWKVFKRQFLSKIPKYSNTKLQTNFSDVGAPGNASKILFVR